jgi:hypothetical protein
MVFRTRNIPSVDNINDVEMQPSINAEQAMRRLPTPDVPDHDQVRYDNDGNFDNEETRFMLFRVRCFVSENLFHHILHTSDRPLEVP